MDNLEKANLPMLSAISESNRFVSEPKEIALTHSLRRVVLLASVAGYVEVIGFLDVGGIYPAIMTGNTVQLGLTAAKAQWAHCGLIGFAVLMFFIGGIIASLIKRHLRQPAIELLIMATLLCVASLVRMSAPSRIPFELPLLAFALAMQGETIARFGGVSLQTIVVTNNMLKFSEALVQRYFVFGKRRTTPENRVPLADVLLPGSAWLSYSVAAGLGALANMYLGFPLLIPAFLLALIFWDLRGDA